jgi:hypothetical protein
MVDNQYYYFSLLGQMNISIKRLNRGHVGKSHAGTGNNNCKNNGKGAKIKSLTRSIAALSTKIDKFSLPDDDDDEDES